MRGMSKTAQSGGYPTSRNDETRRKIGRRNDRNWTINVDKTEVAQYLLAQKGLEKGLDSEWPVSDDGWRR